MDLSGYSSLTALFLRLLATASILKQIGRGHRNNYMLSTNSSHSSVTNAV
jgi:hypothetical protein